LTEIAETGPGPVLPDVPPILIDRVFDDPDRVLDLVERHGPYWKPGRHGRLPSAGGGSGEAGGMKLIGRVDPGRA
jgi:hypothetical protein